MFSATKFVVAGVIVALFGGFLLTGILSQQAGEDTPSAVGASATASTEAAPPVEATVVAQQRSADILVGVEFLTEDVEPGVRRVVSDGLRELSVPVVAEGTPLFVTSTNRVVVAPDGSVWIFGPEKFFRLGDEVSHDGDGRFWGAVDVDRDGTVWALNGIGGASLGRLESFDGAKWDRMADRVGAFAFHPDGVFIARSDKPSEGMGIIGPLSKSDLGKKRTFCSKGGFDCVVEPFDFGFWPRRGEDQKGEYRGWYISSGNAEGWTLSKQGMSSFGPHNNDIPGTVEAMGTGPDGTTWTLMASNQLGVAESGGLGSTSTHFLISGLPDECCAFEMPGERPLGSLEVAADGSVWLASGDGLAHFDGVTWEWFLRDHFIDDFDIAPDGTVWIQATDWQDPRLEGIPSIPEQEPVTSTFVITPEAVAATE